MNDFYNKLKQSWDKLTSQHISQREINLLNTIINRFIGKFEAQQLKLELVNFIGNLFGADRCFIDDYDPSTNRLVTPEYEYLSSLELKSFLGFKPENKAPELAEMAIKGEEIIFSDPDNYMKEKNLLHTQSHKFLKEFHMRSCVYMPIKYGEKLQGMLGIVYVSRKKYFNKSELELIRKICEKIGVALYQIKINSFYEECLDREILMRKIIERVGSTLDLDKVKNYFVVQIARYFKADRVGIALYDENKQSFLPFDENSEYLADPDQYSFVGYDWGKDEIQPFIAPLKQGKEVNFTDIDVFVEENNLQKTGIPILFRSANIGSSYNIPAFCGKKVVGYFCIDFKEKGVVLDRCELNYIRIMANQLGMKISQAELYEKEKQTAEREQLLINIISIIRNTLDIDEIKSKIIEFTSRTLNTDRSIIVEFDSNTKKFLPITYEYLGSPGEKSLIGFEPEKEIPEVSDIIRERKEMLAFDLEKYFQDRGLENCLSVISHRKNNVKTDIAIPIIYLDRLYGTFVLHYTKEKTILKEDQLDFIRSLATQTGAALYQAELYEKEKQTAEREQLLRNIISIISGILDINNIKKTVVEEIGKALNSDRCVIYQVDLDTDKFMPVDKYSEYRSSPDLNSHVGINLEEKKFKKFKELLQCEKKELIVTDIDNPPGEYDPSIIEILKEYQVKSNYTLPIIYSNRVIGILYINFAKEKKTISDEELKFFRALASQTGIFLYQAELYAKEKQAVEREKLLRKIIEATREVPDLNRVKQKIVDEVGRMFNADRCYFRTFDKITEKWQKAEVEYRSSPEVRSVLEVEPDQEGIKYFIDRIEEYHLNFVIKDRDKYIRENKLEDTPLERYLRRIDTKSDYPLPVWDRVEMKTYLVLHYIKEPVYLSDDDISFLETVAAQAANAIDLTQFYENIEKGLERERLLRESAETIRSTLDINQVKKNITESFGKAFNLDRCFILTYNSENDTYFPADEYSEYRYSEDIKSVTGFDFSHPDLHFFVELGKKNIDVYGTCTETDFIEKYQTKITEVIENYFKKFSVNSCFQASIFYMDEFLGILVGHNIKTREDYTPDDKNLIKTLASQTGIALYQSKLYEKEKQTAEREKVQRNIIEKISSTLNIEEVKNLIVTELGKFFKADRCTIRELDPEFNIYMPPTPSAEYLSSLNVKSTTDFCILPFITDSYLKLVDHRKMIVTDDSKKFLEKNNLTGTSIENLIKTFSIKSGIMQLIVAYEEKPIGLLALHYTKENIKLSREDLDFVRSVADQTGIALYKSSLYEKEKNTARRERILRQSTETIRSTLDINTVKKNITESFGKAFDLDRCFILSYDPYNDVYLPLDEFSEYRSSDDVKSLYGFDPSARGLHFFVELGKNNVDVFGRSVQKDFIERFGEKVTEDIKNYFAEFSVKTGFQVPIFYADEFLGLLVGHYTKILPEFSPKDKAFIKTLASQTGIALYQSKLYEKEKQTAMRESFLRKIVETLGSTFDIQKIKQVIVEETCRTFNADRCYFRTFDKRKNQFAPPDVEYIRTHGTSSLIGQVVNQEGLNYFFEEAEKQKNYTPMIINQELLDRKNLRKTPLEEYFNQCGIKTDIAIPMWDEKNELKFLVLHYKKNITHLPEEQVALMETLARQIIVAINNAALFEKERQTAKREKLLRKTIEAARRTLDVKQIKKEIAREIGITLNPDRVFIIEYDTKTETYIQVEKETEYLSSPELLSFVDEDFATNPGFNFIQSLHTKEGDLIYSDVDKFIEENNLQNTDTEKILKKYNIKSLYALLIYYRDIFLGNLVIQYTEEKKEFDEGYLEYLKTLADQAGIAMWQAKLYEKQQQVAEKERILRELVGEIRLSQNIDDVYKYVVSKTAKFIKTDRCFFLKQNEGEEEPAVKHECLNKAGLNSLIDETLPQDLVDILSIATKQLSPFILRDVNEYNPENTELHNFLKEYKIASLLVIPLIRYNLDVKSLGVLVLAQSTPRHWTENEIDILKNISESVVRVVWEISKINEINELRDMFMLTLAHDLQVPLVGEKKAIEYLMSRPKDSAIGNYKEFIETMARDNADVIYMLKRLLDIFYFEAGKKKLNIMRCNIEEPVEEVVSSVDKLARKKFISISTKIQEGLPDLNMDRSEIKKVIYIILENAITYTQNHGTLEVKAYKEENNIIVSIKDNGPGIPEHIQKRLFQRYAMVEAIERKIGSGLGLYLSKNIIEAHGGRIWYKTEIGKGTVFYFSLPLS